jgi:hypothetical protein
MNSNESQTTGNSRAISLRISKLSLLSFLLITLLTGCNTMDRFKKPEMMPLFYLSTHGTEYDHLTTLITMPMSKMSMYVESKPVFYEGDIDSVSLVKVDLGYCVMFDFNAKATRSLYRLAVGNQGKHLLLFVNGQPVGFRAIDSYFEDGSIMMFLEIPERDLSAYVEKLQESIERIKKIKDNK